MLHLEIVTPEKKVFSDKVTDVYLPGADGEIGVLDLHAALVTTLTAGELRYQKDGSSHELAIGSGFAEISDDKLIILTDMALGEKEIDEAATQAAIERAEEQLKTLIITTISKISPTYRVLSRRTSLSSISSASAATNVEEASSLFTNDATLQKSIISN